jgi:hypothetical protein
MGVASVGSDVDFCLVFDVMQGRKSEFLRKALSLTRPYFKAALVTIAYSREEWDAYIAAGSSFELRLKREGVAL